MDRLILMRHAQAEPSSPAGGDAARPLSPSGCAEASLMGRVLSGRGLKPDLALVSPATRTQQTWELMKEAFGHVKVRDTANLYNASAKTLRHLIESHEDEAGCLLVIAHNPGVHVLATEYFRDSDASPAELERLSAGFPPGAAAVFSIQGTGRCTYEGFLTPRAMGVSP
ncbi:SixA phosphatase family protein [Stigmatella aurantiaca]|uniref:phosphohistidine phosphatase SixA n=1 Tax=Stigmatella aurantiaca (strain DW4/3-1) TaxID=378806 RepID=Q09DR8_STIAD|nr:histidine phosphatase family protein [Stigmatella aurantiaca]ADO75248.1 Phosphohistidine phosphatase Sixa [Stigmatella aurantiaca DW4/3-1]EAU69886.1 phosphohistidine phosphatase sixa [Stigmatella aurantiaca DW4/3-1]